MASLNQARKVLKIEAGAILGLAPKLDKRFLQAVKLLLHCKGRVIVMGIGKSGLVGRKIASTLASTGTPALFIHPAEGVHGDLGVLMRDDVVLAVSYSGETDELSVVLPMIKRIGAKLVSLTGNIHSTLAKNSEVALDCSVKEEACPLGLAPTASSAAAMAMGDALAVVLLKEKGFKKEDFAFLHPGGQIGRKLLKVRSIMHSGSAVPLVSQQATLNEAVQEMTAKRKGCTGVVNASGKLCGIFTDDDLRRFIQRSGRMDFNRVRIKQLMNPHPKVIDQDQLVAEAIYITEEKSVGTLMVVDKAHRPVGIVHLHDLLKAGGSI